MDVAVTDDPRIIQPGIVTIRLPAPDEVVPSRYAVRIGEIDVLVISDGVLQLPTKILGPTQPTGQPG